MAGAPPPLGAYLHIPFCARRCDYCAFAAWDDRSGLIDRYVAALRADLRRSWPDGEVATTVFVGGGTPSLLPPGALAGILSEVPVAPGAEVTVECNPDTVTPALVDELVAAGVNRLSFGVQSMVPAVLEALGRTHRPEAVLDAVGAARDGGLPTFNLDLIYGAAGESLDDWARTLDAALALEPPHVSAYALTVEPGTPLADDPGRHPDDDDQADKYELADDRLTAAGLEWYEISNWSRPGHECRHNLLTWAQGDYLAFGCAAHGHRQGRRWWNLRTPDRWVAAVEADADVVAGSEELAGPARRIEALQLAVRTRGGVALDDVGPALPGLEADGLVERVGDRAVLTRRGRLLANEVAVRLG